MTDIESPLGKTSTGPDQPKRVLTVEDRSDPQQFNGPQEMPSHEYPPTQPSVGRMGRPPRQYEAYYDDPPIKEMTAEDLNVAEQNRKASKMAMVSPEAKARVEFLSSIGRITDSTMVDNIKFSFQSLKAREQADIFDQMSDIGSVSTIKIQFEIRAHTLGRAITHINDTKMELIVGTKCMENRIDAARELDESVADYLYKWYQKNIVEKGKEKYSIKSEEDIEEVIEDVKKP